ncbi:MAG TPA: efflux RND transporter periplasmic adaptor subunit [Vicinamibacterales bacterium]
MTRPSLSTLLIVPTLLLAGCSRGAGDAAPADGNDPAVAAPARTSAIEVDTARTAQSQTELEAPSVLQLDETQTARVGAIVDAVVVDLRVNVGDRVSRGALLGTLHSHALHEAVAEYRKALAERRQRATELDYATDAEARARRLFGTKAISQQELVRAGTSRTAAAEALTIAETEVERARNELEHLGVNAADIDRSGDADRIPIRSPIDGVVLERFVAPGMAVTPGTQMFVVSDLSRLWGIAEVDERHLSRLAPGQPATLHVAAYPDTAFDAKVLAIGDTVHETTRRVSVRLAVPNPAGRLKPRMFATARLGIDEPRTVVAVPKAALQTLNDRTVVYVQKEDGEFEPRPVVVHAERGDVAELADGLRAGERVATSGSFLLKSAQTPMDPE